MISLLMKTQGTSIRFLFETQILYLIRIYNLYIELDPIATSVSLSVRSVSQAKKER